MYPSLRVFLLGRKGRGGILEGWGFGLEDGGEPGAANDPNIFLCVCVRRAWLLLCALEKEMTCIITARRHVDCASPAVRAAHNRSIYFVWLPFFAITFLETCLL